MANSNDYFIQRTKQIERRKRIVTYISVASFGGSILFGGLNFVKQAWQQSHQPVVVLSAESELQKQSQGYELVLQKEPNNQSAMEKLSIVRLKLGDKQGAIALMEKLAQQNPNRQEYKTALAEIKKRASQNHQK